MTVVKQKIQEQVDEYIQLHAEVSNLNAQLKKLRKDIEPYMAQKNLTKIEGHTVQGSINIENRNMAVINATYTSYDVDGVVSLLDEVDPDIRSQVLEVRVNKDELEYYVKKKAISSQALDYKLVNSKETFVVKHI